MNLAVSLSCYFGSSFFDKKSERIGFPAHLYLKPTQTWVLVAWQILLPMVTIVLLYLVSVVYAHILLNVSWPLCGPMLLLATALACTQAIIWSMVGFQILRLGTCLLVLAALNAWQFTRYGPIKGYPDVSSIQHMWLQTNPSEILTLVLCLTAACILAVMGVARDRRGDCVGWLVLKQWYSNDFSLLPSGRGTFRSPAAAQFWYEWREKAWAIPVTSGICVAIVTLLYVFGIINAENTMDVPYGMLLLFSMSPVFIGFLMGQCSRESKIGIFKAIRPVTNSELSTMILKTGAISVLSAFAILLFGLLFNSGLLFMFGEGKVVAREWHNFFEAVQKLGYGNCFLMVGIGIICGLGLMGLGASLTFMGRPRLLWGFLLTIYIVFPIFSLLYQFNIMPLGVVSTFLRSAPWVLGIAFPLGTIAAFAAAHRRGLVSVRTLWFASGLWLTLCAIVGFYFLYTDFAWLSKITAKPSFIILGVGMLTLPSAPLATAPLALAWNRHR